MSAEDSFSSSAAPDTATGGGTRALAGPDYAKYSRNTPTIDGGPEGRWVAADESGWNGEALFQPDEPYMSVGSVAIDDRDAAEVVEVLRRDAGIQQAAELKFTHFTGRGRTQRRRLEVLTAALRPGGTLADRASVYMIDKRYFIVSKIIDLLLEEYEHDRGVDLHADDRARQHARTLLDQGPRALGAPLFDELLRKFADFASSRNRGQARVNTAEMFEVLDTAERRSRRRAVTEILARLLRCRQQAEELQDDILTSNQLQAMEPLIPAMAAVLNDWSRRIGPSSLLVDAHKVFSDSRLDIIRRTIARGHPNFRFVWAGAHPRELLRGDSVGHPSVQLADLLAGAGRAVAHFHEGMSTPTAQVGASLAGTIASLITPHSLVAHDEPQRFASQKSLPYAPMPRTNLGQSG